MGTNFYIQETKFCPCCDQIVGEENTYHIGKRSSGWAFLLHLDKEQNINSLLDIIKLWDGKVIIDEYEKKYTPEQMLEIIVSPCNNDMDLDPNNSKYDLRYNCLKIYKNDLPYCEDYGEFS